MKAIIFYSAILLSTFILLFNLNSLGQSDTCFWFAAPNVQSYNSSYNFDKPIMLRITSKSNPCIITISQPANATFSPLHYNISSNSTISVDLTQFISSIENTPANTVLNYGLKISSNNPISVYYEVVSSYCWCSPETFILKGQQSLGNLFYTPFQKQFDNSTIFGTAESSFDIVATQNSTVVTIIPSKNIIGHVAGVPFSITLNKGQTYSAVAQSNSATNHLSGSKITSSKPIAVTIKDDLIQTGTSGAYVYADLTGDQILPVSNLGTKYIATKGYLSASTDDRLYFLATHDNTQITLNSNFSFTLEYAGQDTVVEMQNDAYNIESTHPIYVLQLTGINYETSTILLNPVSCNGLNTAKVVKSANEQMYINLLVQSGGENSFLVNNIEGVITSNDFLAVPGSANWKFARLNLTYYATQGNILNISNQLHKFQLMFIHGASTTGVRTGIMGEFGDELIVLSLGNDTSICNGSSMLLNAGNSESSFMWSNGATTNQISVSQGGTYSVSVTNSCGTSMDTVNVSLIPGPSTVKTGDQKRCGSGTVTLFADNGTMYHWYNDSTGGSLLQNGQSFTTPFLSNSQTFWVANFDGTCESNRLPASAIINEIPPTPLLYFVNNNSLYADVIADSYEWFKDNTLLPYNLQQIPVSESGVYKVRVVSNTCFSDFSQEFQYWAVGTNYPASNRIPQLYTIGNALFIISSEEYSVEITDMNSKTIFKKQSGANEQINLDSFSSGMYFAKYKSDSQLQIRKIAVQ